MARHEGFSRLKSFEYSFFVSTFIWEYGVESFAERPSIQDLWITPVLGSILGEFFMYLEQKIKKNNGRLWGSASLGTFTLGFMDPAGFISRQINEFSRHKYVKKSELHLKTLTEKVNEFEKSKSYLAFELRFYF